MLRKKLLQVGIQIWTSRRQDHRRDVGFRAEILSEGEEATVPVDNQMRSVFQESIVVVSEFPTGCIQSA